VAPSSYDSVKKLFFDRQQSAGKLMQKQTEDSLKAARDSLEKIQVLIHEHFPAGGGWEKASNPAERALKRLKEDQDKFIASSLSYIDGAEKRLAAKGSKDKATHDAQVAAKAAKSEKDAQAQKEREAAAAAKAIADGPKIQAKAFESAIRHEEVAIHKIKDLGGDGKKEKIEAHLAAIETILEENKRHYDSNKAMAEAAATARVRVDYERKSINRPKSPPRTRTPSPPKVLKACGELVGAHREQAALCHNCGFASSNTYCVCCNSFVGQSGHPAPICYSCAVINWKTYCAKCNSYMGSVTSYPGFVCDGCQGFNPICAQMVPKTD
jgi:hypothetical protein